MGRYNFLVEGVSGAGKTSVCHELRRRGVQALNGDTDLAYQGDPVTGEPWHGERLHTHHIWPVQRVREMAGDTTERFTFFCGGSRNWPAFVDVFDEVFVLVLDADTLRSRLAGRADDEFGVRPHERDLVLALHASGAEQPNQAVLVDSTQPLDRVVDEILAHAEAVAARR